MNEPHLNAEWAWSQVEAMADGSLEGKDRRRMRQSMARDERLNAAVAAARDLRRALRRAGGEPVPTPLLRRLLSLPASRRIPAGRRVPRRRDSAPGPSADAARTRVLRWAAAPAAAAAVAALAVALLSDPAPPPADARAAAVREFQTAMTYLQKSAAVTSNGVTRELSKGFREAVSVSRNAMTDDSEDFENGG